MSNKKPQDQSPSEPKAPPEKKPATPPAPPPPPSPGRTVEFDEQEVRGERVIKLEREDPWPPPPPRKTENDKGGE